MYRCSHSHTKHRHSHSRCCSTAKPHGYGGIHLCGKNSTINCLLMLILLKILSGFARFEIFFTFKSIYCLLRFKFRYAFRSYDFSSEGETRADTRSRIRCIAVRIRKRNTAIRTRVVARPPNHTVRRTT